MRIEVGVAGAELVAGVRVSTRMGGGGGTGACGGARVAGRMCGIGRISGWRSGIETISTAMAHCVVRATRVGQRL
jgi:hypothetical protein